MAVAVVTAAIDGVIVSHNGGHDRAVASALVQDLRPTGVVVDDAATEPAPVSPALGVGTRTPIATRPTTLPFDAVNTSMRAVVVIPARNEASSIANVVTGVLNALPDTRVVVIDDASRDATARAAAAAGADVLSLASHTGYAAALRAGYVVALADTPDVVLQLDGDGQHRPSDLPRLMAALPGCDMVLGSRFLGPSPGYTIPPLRRAGIAACRWMTSAVGSPPLTDPTSGLRALSPRVAAGIARDGFPSGLTEISLLIHLHRMGMRITEIPVSMLPSTGDSMHSGLSGGANFVRISWAVLGLAARRSPLLRAASDLPGVGEASAACKDIV